MLHFLAKDLEFTIDLTVGDQKAEAEAPKHAQVKA
jgi:hypothetical protein